jgi:hypothetical protein
VHDHGHHGEHEQPTQPAPEPRDSGSHAPHQHPEPPEHAAGQPERHPVDPHQVTRPQLVVVTIISIIALIAPLVWSAYTYNLRIGADDVEDVVMPPGMVNTRDLPAESMSDMAAVDPDAVSYDAPGDAQGAQPLEPRLENGIKVFDLETSVIEWQILPNVRVMAYAFNRQVPGPTLRVTEGDAVRINVTNRLPESTTVHWHGLILPNEMDGPAEITQEPIEPGETFTYEFTTRQAGTFFYHTHDHVDRQQALGLYGALIIDPSDPSIARGVHLSGDADGRRAAELLHDQRQGISGHHDHSHVGGRAGPDPLHRLPQHGNPPDAYPRRPVRNRSDRRRDGEPGATGSA